MITTIGAILLALLPLQPPEAEWIADPSVYPLQKETLRSGERYRLLADFNGDGIQDMALSYDTNLFGNASGHFWLYIGDGKGKYREHGVFVGSPRAVSLEKFGAKVRIWLYLRGGAAIGVIGYYEVEKDKLSEYRSIEIHPQGTRMGNAIYEAVFENSDLPIRVERSVTKDGIVRWLDF